MIIVKADGTKERFQKKKVISTCRGADASKKVAREIGDTIEKNTKEGDSTKEIYERVLKELEKRKDKTSMIYRLREAISGLTPTCFEKYAYMILESRGYGCEHDEIIEGDIVEHQVDVVAKKKDKNYLVEVKRHINPHRYCGLGTVMEIWARLDDINKAGKERFDKAWMFINTKFSQHARKYAKGKEMRLTGWRTGEKYSLENMIGNKKLFPVTILSLDKDESKRLMRKDIITLQDLINSDVKFAGRKKVIEEAKELVKK